MAPPRTLTLPSQDELRKLLRYNPKTGQLFWRKRPQSMFKDANSCLGWNNRFAGKEAFTYVNAGHRRGTLGHKNTYAHQVIWKLMTGNDAEEINHIDGNGLNNTWTNLRNESGANQKNCTRRKDNTSGQVGVVRRGERWIAQYGQDGTTHHIGVFETKEAAIKARKAVEEAYGFHRNHGRKKD